MKREVKVWDYAGQILETVGKGILLTTKADDKVNTMTIGWGTLGVDWRDPVFIAFVRKSRFTEQQLQKNPEFTVNIPLGEVDKKIISFCGTKSGRDVDKIEELGLTLEEPETISVPGIRQLPLTLECKVVYRQAQDLEKIPQEYLEKLYQKGTPNDGDYHIAYYGKITAAYIIE